MGRRGRAAAGQTVAAAAGGIIPPRAHSFSSSGSADACAAFFMHMETYRRRSNLYRTSGCGYWTGFCTLFLPAYFLLPAFILPLLLPPFTRIRRFTYTLRYCHYLLPLPYCTTHFYTFLLHLYPVSSISFFSSHIYAPRFAYQTPRTACRGVLLPLCRQLAVAGDRFCVGMVVWILD